LSTESGSPDSTLEETFFQIIAVLETFLQSSAIVLQFRWTKKLRLTVTSVSFEIAFIGPGTRANFLNDCAGRDNHPTSFSFAKDMLDHDPFSIDKDDKNGAFSLYDSSIFSPILMID